MIITVKFMAYQFSAGNCTKLTQNFGKDSKFIVTSFF